MGKCINHPDRETPYLCMKHQIYLCEECLHCKDPNVYCKHRPGCPIWFMSKRQEGWAAEDQQEAAAAAVSVTFMPDGQTVDVPVNTSLLDAARIADVHVNASCNGKGSCGKCKLKVTNGTADAPPTPLLSDGEKARAMCSPAKAGLPVM